ncbi:MAG: Rrf2 family transcriptional regulator [Saprospiraceae bacterium]|jgi:Rrf2 family protein
MFSKTCQYAIRAVLYLAVHTSDKNAGVNELAEALNAPKHFLAKILQQLSKHGLVSSIKGPNGGFFMGEKNLKATLEDIILCIDGPDVFTGCVMGLPQCSGENPCPLHVQANAYRQGLQFHLKYQSIGEMAVMVERQGLNL